LLGKEQRGAKQNDEEAHAIESRSLGDYSLEAAGAM
jgi:hypothetical protein